MELAVSDKAPFQVETGPNESFIFSRCALPHEALSAIKDLGFLSSDAVYFDDTEISAGFPHMTSHPAERCSLLKLEANKFTTLWLF